MKYFRKYTTVKEALDYEVEHNDFVITGWPFIPAVQIQTPSGTDTSFERHHVHTKVGPSFNAGYFSDDFSTSDNYGRKIYLPDNWVLLSYIENTVAAGAFINTGYVPSMTSTDTLTTLDFDITFSINELPLSGNDGILFSICGTSCIVNSSGNLSFAGATVSTALSTNTKYTLHIHWEVSGAGSSTYNVSMSIYNVTDLTSTDKLVGTATSTYNISNDPLYLFDTTSSLVGKLYYFGVYEDNDITLDMVPVVGQDNMAGMYNIRNAEFMGNSNTYTGPMYMTRTVGDYMAATGEYARVDSVHGNSLVWNQIVDSSTASVTLTSGHKYYTKIGGTGSVITGSGNTVSVTGGSDMVVDLTAMFGSTVAATMTAAQFESMFPADYYPYNAGQHLYLYPWKQYYEIPASPSIGETTPFTAPIITTNNYGVADSHRMVTWNQLVQNADFSNGTTGWSVYQATINVTNNECFITLTNPTFYLNQTLTITANHRYYLGYDGQLITSQGSATRILAISDSNDRLGFPYKDIGAIGNNTSSIHINSIILKTSTSGSTVVRFIRGYQDWLTGDVLKVDNFIFVDLTLMYGSGNEPSDPAYVEGVINKLFPNGSSDRYTYNATGTVMYYYD